MTLAKTVWATPEAHFTRTQPERPVMYFNPAQLQRQAQRFVNGFPGLVSYAVKANPARGVLDNLVAAGITAFDVASPAEMEIARQASPGAVLNYHNPVRSLSEIAIARPYGISSWSVDCFEELDKLASLPPGAEIAVRLCLPVTGAAYDFGSKFGAGPDLATQLLRAVVSRGFTPAMTFHPGTQCKSGAAWAAYIRACAKVAQNAGVALQRLNVGGGFPADRGDAGDGLEQIFTAIHSSAQEAFPGIAPRLVCEPGRAMVSGAFKLLCRIKARRGAGAIMLNEGIYGALAELRDMPPPANVLWFDPAGNARPGPCTDTILFGPTCDSIDRLRDCIALPETCVTGDYLLFPEMGAYSNALATEFNGYGLADIVTVAGWNP